MKRVENVAFTLKRTFFSFDTRGNVLRYFEAIAYFTDLNSALKERGNYRDSFVFPFNCNFFHDRRVKKNLIRSTFH